MWAAEGSLRQADVTGEDMNNIFLKDAVRQVIGWLFRLYAEVYKALSGEHPHLMPWHFQWHALRELNRELGNVLPSLEGKVLDMGCGMGPYRPLLEAADSYTGADIVEGPGVDAVIEPGKPLPFKADAFDAVISTQVFEHVDDLDFTLSEIRRVLKPGGKLVASVPFIYQIHGAPNDYRRFSEYGLERELKGFHIESVRRQGGIGSSLAILFLCWFDTQVGNNLLAWVLRGVLLPVWLMLCLVMNVCALLLDWIDTTESVYHNLLVVARLT